jgi:hypothetical protein
MLKNHRFLWTLQVLLALLFAFAGVSKLVMDPVELAASGLPAAFLQFIGISEALGAIGLILPQLTGIRPWLTALAACGLIVIMAGATIVTLLQQPPLVALVPFATGLLLVTVAYGRTRPRMTYPLAERA